VIGREGDENVKTFKRSSYRIGKAKQENRGEVKSEVI